MPTIAGLKGLDDGSLAVIVDPATYSTEAGSITLWTEEEKDHALRSARLEAVEEYKASELERLAGGLLNSGRAIQALEAGAKLEAEIRRSARLEALEEAAKIAEEFDGSGFEDTWGDEAASGAASCIADAIRERAKA